MVLSYLCKLACFPEKDEIHSSVISLHEYVCINVPKKLYISSNFLSTTFYFLQDSTLPILEISFSCSDLDIPKAIDNKRLLHIEGVDS